MKPPMCKVCGFAHWSNDPHYTGAPAKTIDAKPVRKVATIAHVDHSNASLAAAVAKLAPSVVRASDDISFGRPLEFANQAEFDAHKAAGAAAAKAAKKPRGRPVAAEPASPRAEYQRELMRKRRASAKVTKP